MENLVIFCVVIIAVFLQTAIATNETIINADNITRQPRYSRLEEPILLIRPVTKDSPTLMRLPIHRKTNPIPMSPMIGNGFFIRAKTDDGEDDESVVKEFISHFGQVVTRIDHGSTKKAEQTGPKYISLPPNVNYFIKNIQSPQPKKKISTSNFVYRPPPSTAIRHRPAGFLKKRNIKSEPIQQHMTPQFRASPQIPFKDSSSYKPLSIDSSSSSDDWTPTPSITSPKLMHEKENKQYHNQQFIKSQKEKLAYTQYLMERPVEYNDDFKLDGSAPSQTSFSSTIIAVPDNNKIPSFKPKVSLRVAGDEKLKTRTRLKPVREHQDESKKLDKQHDSQNGEENVQISIDNETESPLFVTPIESSTKKSTKLFKHPSSPKQNDSCEGTCLMNIINVAYDPLCGSDGKTYVNVGRFRCTKICGQFQLTIKHFGSCESKKSVTI